MILPCVGRGQKEGGGEHGRVESGWCSVDVHLLARWDHQLGVWMGRTHGRYVCGERRGGKERAEMQLSLFGEFQEVIVVDEILERDNATENEEMAMHRGGQTDAY